MSEREPLSEGQFIGKLIMATEGRSLRYNDLPPMILVKGAIKNRLELVWNTSEQDQMKREFILLATTKGDRKLHLPKELQVGTSTSGTLLFFKDTPLTKMVFAIHAHGIMDGPPSPTDVTTLFMGNDGLQAHFITTESADFLIVRTDQTPVHGDVKQVLRALTQKYDTDLEMVLKEEDEAFKKLVQNAAATKSFTPILVEREMHAYHQRINTLTISHLLEICHGYYVGLYYSPKNGEFTQVTDISHLKNYLETTTKETLLNVHDKVRKLEREHNPELRKIDSTKLSETFIVQAVQLMIENLNEEVLSQHFSGSVDDLKAQYAQTQGTPDITLETFIAVVLEKADHDLQNTFDDLKYSLLIGMIMVMAELDIISSEEDDQPKFNF